MASLSIALTAVPLAGANTPAALFIPLQHTPAAVGGIRRSGRLQVRASASVKERAVAAATMAAVAASLVVPQVAEAASVSPSLKNYLLSIVSGGVVAVGIVGVVVAVSYFDPVRRG